MVSKILKHGLYKQCLMSAFPKYNCIYVKLLVLGTFSMHPILNTPSEPGQGPLSPGTVGKVYIFSTLC